MACVPSHNAIAQSLRNQKSPSPLKIEKEKILYNEDEHGNRLLDYSLCGYRMSETKIPDLPVAITVTPQKGDMSAAIQNAIDYVSAQKPDKKTGLRGAVLLDRGTYELSQPLRIKASGVVLRGVSKKETILKKNGVDRGAVVYIEGINDLKVKDTLSISNDYLAIGNCNISTSANATAGDRLIIVRPSTKEWIQSIGCDVFGGGLGYWGWKPGEMDVRWDRKVTSCATGTITIDAPLTVTLDKQWGEAYALLYSWPGRIADSGVENLTIESAFTSAYNEDHAWDGVYIDNAEDCWVRMVDFKGLAGSAVIVHRGAQQVTVEDCSSRAPQSEVGGLRRRTFLTMGGKCLFLRCYSEEGINDFSAGYCAPGPNAFVQCDAVRSNGFSGSSSSWATGLLFDNVNIDNGNISFKNLGLDKWGAGWNTANSMLWQCTASGIDCYDASEDARCYAIGCWAYCQGDGFWASTNDHVNPRSLFEAQLSERTDATHASALCRTLVRNTDASSSPSVEKAMLMAEEALKPRLTLEQWVEQAVFSASTDMNAKGSKSASSLKLPANATKTGAVEQTNRVFVNDDMTMKMGTFHRTPWWNGRTRYPYMDKADYAVTRFVPGMEQRGGTDRVDSVLVTLERQDVCLWNQNYGLWYDRRRDDHERINRKDGDVWAPFWEQAFARTGEGKAWDGLSKYDLTRLNPWYIHRVSQLAEGRPEMIVINQHYFQHNILEAGAHWVDCPWRSVNNINGTDFLEPVPFTGDKRIFTAEAFYDTNHAKRAALHRQYIHQMLDAFSNEPNVYHSISEEFTGPQHFVEFWLECIAEWEKTTGKNARIILNATRDVQEAVLAKPELAAVVDAIEIEQWFYDNGKLYAPEGGKNLAPRQHLRLTKTGHPTADDVYRSVAETSKAHPDKPVLYLSKAFDRYPWAVLFAGGSCPTLSLSNAELCKALTLMSPVFPADLAESQKVWMLKSADGSSILVYNNGTDDQTVTLPSSDRYTVYGINPKDGSARKLSTTSSNTISFNSEKVLWLKR